MHQLRVPVKFAGLLLEQRESNMGGFASFIFPPAPLPSHCELFHFRSSATITSNRQLQLTNPTVPMYKSAYGLCYDLDSKENSPLKLLEHTIQNVYLGLKNVQQMSSTVAVLSQYSLDTPHFGCKPSLSNCCCKQTIYYIMHNKTNRSI